LALFEQRHEALLLINSLPVLFWLLNGEKGSAGATLIVVKGLRFGPGLKVEDLKLGEFLADNLEISQFIN